MPKIENNRSQDSESYDVWEAGFRNYIRKTSVSLQDAENLPLVPCRVMDTTRNDQRWFQHMNYQYMALELILSGAMECRTEHETVIARAGMLYVVAPGSNVCMVNSGKGQRRKLCMLISGSCLSSVTDSLGFHSDCLLKLTDPVCVEEMMREIEKGIAEQKSQEYLSVKCYELLLFLRKDLPLGPPELRPVLNLIDANPTVRISVPEMAKKCGLSESALRRKFYEFAGISPGAYLLQKRLTLSRERLKEKTSIKEISEKCGFTSPLRFSLAYKKFYGESPSCTRKKMLK